jgi:hypothetical protein
VPIGGQLAQQQGRLAVPVEHQQVVSHGQGDVPPPHRAQLQQGAGKGKQAGRDSKGSGRVSAHTGVAWGTWLQAVVTVGWVGLEQQAMLPLP